MDFLFVLLVLVFGYLFLEQFRNKLSENNFINLTSRHNTSLLPKILKKIYFYKYYPLGKKEKYNRVSLYEMNKQIVFNLCMMLYNKYGIDGVYQPNINSFWYPDLIIHHMNIEEFILFSPHTELENSKIVN